MHKLFGESAGSEKEQGSVLMFCEVRPPDARGSEAFESFEVMKMPPRLEWPRIPLHSAGQYTAVCKCCCDVDFE